MTLSTPAQKLSWWKLVLVLAAGMAAFALSAGLFTRSGGEDVVPAVPALSRGTARTTPAVASPMASATDSAVEQLRLDPEVRQNPFGPLNVKPAAVAALGLPAASSPAAPKPAKPASAAVAPPPPAPSAPPLPFTAIGSIQGSAVGGGDPIAFLQQGDTLLVVHKGDSLGQAYRVDSVSTDKVEFTYLPLHQRQWLSLSR